MINFSFVPGLIRALGGILKALFFYKAGRDSIIKNQEKLAKEAAERLNEEMRQSDDLAFRLRDDDFADRMRDFLNHRNTKDR